MPIVPSAIPLPGQSLADLYPEIAAQWLSGKPKSLPGL